jgi:hypothetical protein
VVFLTQVVVAIGYPENLGTVSYPNGQCMPTIREQLSSFVLTQKVQLRYLRRGKMIELQVNSIAEVCGSK